MSWFFLGRSDLAVLRCQVDESALEIQVSTLEFAWKEREAEVGGGGPGILSGRRSPGNIASELYMQVCLG